MDATPGTGPPQDPPPAAPPVAPAPSPSATPGLTPTPPAAERMPAWVFWLAMAWALALIATFVLDEVDSGFAQALPAKVGPLPLSVVWFGAAGGLLVSLSGIFKYNRAWNPSFEYWHACRPLLGAFIGSIGSLVFLVLTEAAEKKTGAPNSVFYAVISFSLGYREESFRALLLRLIDTVIVPAQPSAPTPNTFGGSGVSTPNDATQAGTTIQA